MNSTANIRVSNEERQLKKQRLRLVESHHSFYTFGKEHYRKDSMPNALKHEQQRMGYNYDCEDSRVLKWMKEEFTHKMSLYLGNKAFTYKMDRFDKMEKKKELNFSRKPNPLTKILQKIDRKAYKCLLLEGFRCLTRK